MSECPTLSFNIKYYLTPKQHSKSESLRHDIILKDADSSNLFKYRIIYGSIREYILFVLLLWEHFTSCVCFQLHLFKCSIKMQLLLNVLCYNNTIFM